MAKIRQIALLVDASRAYGRGICQGVANFAAEREDWLILPMDAVDLPTLARWHERHRLDGIIAYVPSPELGVQLAALGVPIVDVQGQGNCPSAPVFDTDPGEVASLAIRFYLEAGFAHFAFCGYPGVFYSDRRSAAFLRELEEKGLASHAYAPAEVPAGLDAIARERGGFEFEAELSAWLGALPKPVAILAANDIRGQQVIGACRTLDIAVPEDVAVMGVDNDEIVCRLCRPTLSSIAPDTERIGMLAADLLQRMLTGEAVAPGLVNVAPTRVVERHSTDTTTARHPIVLQATRIIRDRACGGISVDQVCDSVGCSRSTLDNLFKKFLGRPVAREMLRIRLNRSMRLLADTDLSIKEIAWNCGFPSPTYFCRFFKRETGLSPFLYRSKILSP